MREDISSHSSSWARVTASRSGSSRRTSTGLRVRTTAEVLRQVLDGIHGPERLLEGVGGVTLVLGEPHHGVRVGVVLVDVARAGIERQGRLAAHDLEELVQVQRRGHGPGGADEGRELAVPLLGGTREVGVVQSQGGDPRHLADEPLVVRRERPVVLLLGQLEHAEHLVAVDDGRPDGGPFAPVLHGLETGGGGVDIVVGVGDEDLAVLDDACEAGGIRERVHLADPVDVVAGEDPGPERLGAQSVALGQVLVHAALRAVERGGDLLGELDQRVAEDGVLSLAPVMDERV